MKKNLYIIVVTFLLASSCQKEIILSNEAKILSFSLLNVKGSIDEAKKEITVTLPAFTDVAALTSTYEVSTRATLLQGSALQQSNLNSHNYGNIVTFTVQAEDGTKVDYKVIVNVTKSNEAKLLSFYLKKTLNTNAIVPEDAIGCLKNTTMTLNLVAPDQISPNSVAIIPSFSISKGAKLLIDGVEIESDKTSFKYSGNSTSLVVKAQDGTEQKYNLNLTSQILNIEEFLKKCPTNDILFTKFTKDFEIRRNGEVVTNYNCTNKYDVTLRVLQAIRVIYYIDIYKKSSYLPWTNLRFYDWLKDKVQGFDIVDDLGGAVGVCCAVKNGRNFISLKSTKTDSSYIVKYTYEDWFALAGFISLIGHERRHADPGNYPHNGNCNNVGGDAEYNEKDLGSYGVAYWISKAFKTGILEVGVKCLSNIKQAEINNLTGENRWAATYFCKNPPPISIAPNYKDCACN